MRFFLNSKRNSPTPLNTVLSSLMKWSLIIAIVGISIGSTVALFLYLLEAVTNYRTAHTQLIYLLPLAGLFIGLLYYYFGKNVESGNHLLIKEYQTPETIIPIKMVPLILIGTLSTHLFGGSAGREGTAVQVGGAIADQFSRFFNLDTAERKLLLAMGISAGFAAVFGTPWAGTLFAIEVLVVGNLRYKAFIVCLITSFLAHYNCEAWNIQHTVYQITEIPPITVSNISLILGCGLLFGLTSWVFMKSTQSWNQLFTKWISFPPLRPFIGGILIVLLFLVVGSTKYLGLGIPTIQDSFIHAQTYEVFLLKILFTSLTLGAAFKGGEVTPLFFIGAALGSFLSIYTPLPISLLAGIGFVAVFAGATKAPWACSLMGIELFGMEAGIYILIACWMAAAFSGNQNLYSSPPHPQLSKPYNWVKKQWHKHSTIRSSNR